MRSEFFGAKNVKKFFLSFFIIVGLVFGASGRSDEKNIEHLSRLLSMFTDEKVTADDKRDIILFYNAFIDPLESNAQISKKINELYKKYGNVLSSMSLSMIELTYFEKLKKTVLTSPAIIHSKKEDVVLAISETIASIDNESQKDLRFFRNEKAKQEYLELVNFFMGSLRSTVQSNSTYFLTNCSENVRSDFSLSAIVAIVMLYFLDDSTWTKPIEIKIINKGLVQEQMRLVLDFVNIHEGVLPKPFYSNAEDFIRDITKKENTLDSVMRRR